MVNVITSHSWLAVMSLCEVERPWVPSFIRRGQALTGSQSIYSHTHTRFFTSLYMHTFTNRYIYRYNFPNALTHTYTSPYANTRYNSYIRINKSSSLLLHSHTASTRALGQNFSSHIYLNTYSLPLLPAVLSQKKHLHSDAYTEMKYNGMEWYVAAHVYRKLVQYIIYTHPFIHTLEHCFSSLLRKHTES